MAKASARYVCQECGAVHPRWAGKCDACGGWNCIVEEAAPQAVPKGLSGGKGRRIDFVGLEGGGPPPPRRATGIAELDRVCGGGLVPGSVLLVGGDPGIGKSTLLLQAVAALAKAGARCAYVSGEEAVDQVRLRAARLGLAAAPVALAAATSVRDIAATVLRPMTATPKIELVDVCKSFGPKRVLDGVSLRIEPGESLVVIGGSGSGKSVMLKCILGLMEPETGAVRIDGVDTAHLRESDRVELLRRFGMLFQGSALFDSLPVWENVAFGLIQGRRMPRRKAREVAIEKLAAVGLAPEVGELSPAELSGGMQKRVALARAIAAEPEIVFLDEPTTGLDPIMADVINNLIVKCVRELGATAVSITHDMASARKIADRVTMLYKGRLIWAGPKESIDAPGNPYVDQFIHGRAEGPITMELRR